MDSNVLRDQLTKLHAELRGVRQVDPRSNQLLVDVLQDIQRLLEQQRVGDAPSGPEPSGAAPGAAPVNPSLPERLEKIAVQFEVDHPTLAVSSRRLVDLLGKVGL
jgi:Domain of unknown function (DUF4404)